MEISKYNRQITLALILLTAVSVIPLRQLSFDFSVEQFFPAHDPDLVYFEQFQERFFTQIDDEYILIAVRNDDGIFQRSFLEKVDTITRFLAAREDIPAVYSITNLAHIEYNDDRFEQAPLIHIDNPEGYRSDSIKLFQTKEYRELMISGDGRSLAITALNRPGLADSEKQELLESIEDFVHQLEFDRSHICAKIKLEETYIQEIRKNLSRYIVVSFLLIALILILLYRSVSGVVIPLTAILITILLTLSLIGLSGKSLDILSSLLPTVIAVICMSDIIHINSKFNDELRAGKTRSQALSATFKQIGAAALFTSITTAAGFYSLSVSNILPIRFFGIFAGTGVLIALVISVGLLTVAYSREKLPGMTRKTIVDGRWAYQLERLAGRLMDRRKTIIFLSILLLIPSAFFISRIQIDSSLLQELPRGHSIRQDYAFIENEFSGTRAFEMALELQYSSASFLDTEVLTDVEELENFLADSLGVGSIFSPVTFIKGAYKALRGGGQENWVLPDNQQDVYTCFDKLLFSPVGGDMIRYLTQDAQHARISGKTPNLTIKEFEALSERLERFFQDREEAFGINYRLTGSALLIDKVSYSLVRNLFIGLAIGFCVISLIVFIMFRSLKMVIIVLTCNIFPLLIMAAVMGALGIYLKADTAIIFAISFGIVVDDSIHFINRYRLERSNPGSPRDALIRTFRSTGKAMIITTAILFAGFISLVFSSFGGTFYIGLLVSLCLVVALTIDLTLLPVLILMLDKKQRTLSDVQHLKSE